MIEKQIKGSLVKLFVKGIRGSKYRDEIFKNLSKSAKELVDERILDPQWYSFESFKELLNIMCKIEAKNNPDILIEWGKRFGEITLTGIYKLSVGAGDIKTIIERYNRFHRKVFSFGDIEAEFPSDNELIVEYKNFEPDWKCFYQIAIAWLAKYLELCMDTAISFQIVKESWKGDDHTAFRCTWEGE